MELENLKYIWRQLEDKPAQETSDDQIRVLMAKRPRIPIARMRRNLTWEMIIVGLTYIPAIGYYFSGFGGRLSEIGWFLFIVMAFFAGYAYRKSKLLNKMLCVTCQVRSSLERQIALLEKYTRFYRRAGTLLIPLMAAFTFLIIYWKFPVSPVHAVSKLQITLLLLLLGACTTGSWYFNTWYINKLYGRHIKKLKGLLREMNEE